MKPQIQLLTMVNFSQEAVSSERKPIYPALIPLGSPARRPAATGAGRAILAGVEYGLESRL